MILLKSQDKKTKAQTDEKKSGDFGESAPTIHQQNVVDPEKE
jgi:hypothetical protein